MTDNRPSSWVNLQDYLGINQQQSDEMGNRLNQSLRNKAQTAQQQIGAATTKFQSQANAGALSDPNARSVNGQTYGSMAAPTSAQAAQLAAHEYSGPKQLSDVDANVSASVADAVARLNASKTNAGAAQLMREEYKTSASPYYGAGASGFDAFLAGAGSGGESLAATQSKFGGLENELGVAQTEAGKFGDAALARNNAARSVYSSMAGSLKEQEDAYAAEQAHKKALADAQAFVERVPKDIADRKVQEEAARQLADFKFWHGGETPEEVAQDRQRMRDSQRNNTGRRRSNEQTLDENGNPI